MLGGLGARGVYVGMIGESSCKEYVLAKSLKQLKAFGLFPVVSWWGGGVGRHGCLPSSCVLGRWLCWHGGG